MIYVAFRRGNWLAAAAKAVGLYTLLRPLIACLVRHSWMSVSLVTHVECTAAGAGGGGCQMCRDSPRPSAQSGKPHLVFYTMHEDFGGILRLVDRTYDRQPRDPEEWSKWLLVGVASPTGTDLNNFVRRTSVAKSTYNYTAARLNFLPAWLRLCRRPVGMRAHEVSKNDFWGYTDPSKPAVPPKSMFCSEFVMAFLLFKSVPLPPPASDPCTTTPQQLYASLLATPRKQYTLEANSSELKLVHV